MNNERSQLFIKFIKVPQSGQELDISLSEKKLVSKKNNFEYLIKNNIPIFFTDISKSDQKIVTWWTDLYKQLYQKFDESLDETKLEESLKLFYDLMKKQNHLIYRNLLNKFDIKEKIVLEIGSGSGAHSALLKSKGARMLSCDISLDRCKSTNQKLELIKNDNESLVINCSAEKLPIKDNSVDFVYSNGVLHHAENTNNCINEVFRVLKKNGVAVIMLYCRQSAEYYCNILPKAIIKRSFFKFKKEENWVGEVTEGKTKFSNVKNPVTRVYNRDEILKLFENFNILSLDKTFFSFKDFAIPKLTQIREVVFQIFGKKAHKGGEIVYGKPVVPLLFLEKKLGKYAGFFWYINGKK